MKLTPAQNRALTALHSGTELTSDGDHEVRRVTVEALARYGLCEVTLSTRTEEVHNRRGFTNHKTRIAWRATLIDTPHGGTQQEPDTAWTAVSASGKDLGRVWAYTRTEAVFAAVELLNEATTSAAWSVRMLSASEAAGWIKDFCVGGDVHRLERASHGGYLVRHVATGDVLVIRDTPSEAEQDTRKDVAALRVALSS